MNRHRLQVRTLQCGFCMKTTCAGLSGAAFIGLSGGGGARLSGAASTLTCTYCLTCGLSGARPSAQPHASPALVHRPALRPNAMAVNWAQPQRAISRKDAHDAEKRKKSCSLRSWRSLNHVAASMKLGCVRACGHAQEPVDNMPVLT